MRDPVHCDWAHTVRLGKPSTGPFYIQDGSKQAPCRQSSTSDVHTYIHMLLAFVLLPFDAVNVGTGQYRVTPCQRAALAKACLHGRCMADACDSARKTEIVAPRSNPRARARARARTTRLFDLP